MNFKYRSEIDGLRAIAVIPVVLFHAGFGLFDGGFVGVDVFFVISGYLITTIILKELGNNAFSLKNFYERRARRILPALIFVILITSILSFIFLTKSELASYFKSVNATLFFYSNFYFWKATPYFNSEADLEPLLHTWSLSIEEQFYLLFPITLIFLFSFFRKYIFLFFVVGMLISLLFCQIFSLKTGGTLNFYFTFSRAWELALGAICSYLTLYKYKQNNFSIAFKNFYSVTGIILILFSVFYFNRQIIYPSFYTLVPTVGTALIIMFADKDTIIKKVLSFRIFVLIGLISYSLYLWHQPLLAFGRIFFETFSIKYKLLLIFIAILLSVFSYFFIEKNFRNKNIIKSNFFLKLCLISVFLIFIFSQSNINFFLKKNNTEAMLAKLLVNNEGIYSTKMDDRQFIKNRIIYETIDPKILVIGSSRIMKISNENFNEQILNLSVSGASIEDQITIIEMAIEKFNPDQILLGADPWLFNKNNNQTRWKSIQKEYQFAIRNINSMNKKEKILPSTDVEKNYFFYEHFLDKFYNFLNIRKLEIELGENSNDNLTKDIILKDGSRVYRKQEVKTKIKPTVVDYSMEKYVFSNDYYNIYKTFIEYLQKTHNKEVILVLSPYYSPSYELTIKEKPFYLELEKKFKELSKETNIQIIGSYNPLLTTCSADEFFDSIHPKPSCMKKITEQIK
jgi:peptidoglycan/LPS O-acetylase OafA/YrhL